MNEHDELDALLAEAARSKTDPGLDGYDPEGLLEHIEGRADSQVELQVEAELAGSKSRRELWRALQDERRAPRRRWLRWAVPLVAAAAAVLLAVLVWPPREVSWQIGALPSGLAVTRGDGTEGPPRYGPEHHPELSVRGPAGAVPKLRLYRVGPGGALQGVPSERLRRSEWVHTLRFSAQAVSGGRPGPVRLVMGPNDEDWSGRAAEAVRPLAERRFVYVP